MASYARAVGPPKLAAKAYWLNKSEYESAKGYTRNEGEKVFVSPPEEVVIEKEKLEVVYHTQAVSTCPIEKVSTEEIEICLKEVMKKAVLVERGSAYGTVVVTFRTEEEAVENATRVLKSETIIMSPSYGGKKCTRIRIGNIPIKYSVEWVLAGLFKDEDMKIEEVGTTPALNWWGYGVEVWVSTTQEQLERLPHQIYIRGGRWLNVIVYGRLPICFCCHRKGHMKAYCPERRNEEMNVVKTVVEEDKEEGEKEEMVYEEISEETTGSEDYMTPKRRRKSKKKKGNETDSKLEVEQVKNEEIKNTKKEEGKKAVTVVKKVRNVEDGDPNDTVFVARMLVHPVTSLEDGLWKEGRLLRFWVGKDDVNELFAMKRKIFVEYGINIMNKKSEVWAVVEAGREVKPKMKLKEIMELKGWFKYKELNSLLE